MSVEQGDQVLPGSSGTASAPNIRELPQLLAWGFVRIAVARFVHNGLCAGSNDRRAFAR